MKHRRVNQKEVAVAANLDATTNPPKGVASPSSISVFVGNPPSELRIYSGVAMPEWDSRSDLDFEDVIVTLGPPTTDYFQATSTASLASIMNTDSNFVFAANETSVVNGPTGLELRVKIAVLGDKSVLSRFSYHVQVLSDPIVSKISGTIHWKRSLSDPTEAAKAGAVNMFRVGAGTYVLDPGPSGGFSSYKWVESAYTLTDTAPILVNGFWAVPYIITDVPLDRPQTVQPALLGGLVKAVDAGFAPQPQVVTLTRAAPMAVGVDFEMISAKGGLG